MTSLLTVQFADSTEKAIITFFGAPQDADNFQNLGTVEPTDSRWAMFYGQMRALGLNTGLPEPIAD